ncbi:MAG: putative sulfate exporter family transporter [Campylobacterales bacterium]|nr:putative sulfate exporter family transporter [Campylobacterales bacterium]
MKNIYGLVLSCFVALFAFILAKYFPIGSVALAIVLGAIIGNGFKIKERFNPGITFSEKTLLAWAIGLMGINLDFTILSSLGWQTLLIIVLAMIFTIYSAVFLASRFGFDKNFALIIGVGNGVCGSAAIAATKDIVGLNKEKTALAVAIVNFLGTLGIFLLPIVATVILGFGDIQAGVLIGNTLQAVGHVVASGFSMNDAVGQSATIVKMGRVLLLGVVVIGLIYYVSKKHKDPLQKGTKSKVPGFIWGFIGLAIVATFNILPTFIVELISLTSKYLLLIAMAAIGLKISFKTIKEHGSLALKLGSYIFLLQILFSIVLITILL